MKFIGNDYSKAIKELKEGQRVWITLDVSDPKTRCLGVVSGIGQSRFYVFQSKLSGSIPRTGKRPKDYNMLYSWACTSNDKSWQVETFDIETDEGLCALVKAHCNELEG